MESEARIREFAQSYKRLEEEYPEDPKLVYLASAYRSARGDYGVSENIEAARPVARRLWKLGLAVICPAMNTAHLNGCDIPDSVWLTGDFVMIRMCDALVVHENGDDSAGVKEEIEVAREAGVRIFWLPAHWRKIAAWAKKREVQLCGHP